MEFSEENTPRDFQLGGDVSEGATSADRLPARIERYGSARVRARQMVTHLEQLEGMQWELLASERDALRHCGNYLLFHHYYTVGDVRLAAMKSCKKHLLCPLCAIRRGAKSLRAYLDRFQVITADRPMLRPFLVTFAIKNGDDLDERQRHLAGSYRQLCNRRRHWLKGTRRAKWTESAKAKGAVWGYETTNIGNGWHPHLHAIWLCETRPDQQALRDEWEAITGDSFTVDVRPMGQDRDLAEDFCEVFKYATKFGELSLADNVEAYWALKGKRLLGSFGCFRGVQVPEALTDDLPADLPYIELLYRFQPEIGAYGLSRPAKRHEAPTPRLEADSGV